MEPPGAPGALGAERAGAVQRADRLLGSQDDLYGVAELLQHFIRVGDLDDEDLDDVPCSISWTRIGPWLPG